MTTTPEDLAAFPNRYAVEREIEAAENPAPGAMQLNDGHERIRLPGGTLRRMLAVIDRLAAMAASAQQSGEAVAWRWIPSAVWGEYVIVGDKAHGERAAAIGMQVEPLYTRPQQVALTPERMAELTANTRIAFGEMAGAFNDGVDAMSTAVEEYLAASGVRDE